MMMEKMKKSAEKQSPRQYNTPLTIGNDTEKGKNGNGQ